MDRRTAIRNCFILSVGTAILPSCMQDRSKSGLLLKNIKINSGQEQMIAALADAIIPSTDTPGAKDVGAHLFVLMMIDDCYKPEEQEAFVTGLNQFEDLTRTKFKKEFVELSSAERTALLTEMEARKEEKDIEAIKFYKAVRGLTIQSFTGSQYYLTKVRVYEMVPGRYHGCVPVKTIKA